MSDLSLFVFYLVPHVFSFFFFFFQAEDGIRDLTVTGVQTCALPILQDWLVDAKFGIELPGQTTLGVGQFEAFELFQDLGFRKSAIYASFYTAWLKDRKSVV